MSSKAVSNEQWRYVFAYRQNRLYLDNASADLYDERIMPVELRTAHKNNDQAVLAAYNLPKNITEEEIVAFLMQEYQKRTTP